MPYLLYYRIIVTNVLSLNCVVEAAWATLVDEKIKDEISNIDLGCWAIGFILCELSMCVYLGVQCQILSSLKFCC